MIETQRLKLIPATADLLELYLESQTKFAEKIGAQIAEEWLVFPEVIPFVIEQYRRNAANDLWGMYLFICTDEAKLIGSGGYKGAPDEDGMVEIGYAVAPAYRNFGYATETAAGMIANAFDYEDVKMVDAHTLAEENASTTVLKKCGMTKIAEKSDPEDGNIWQWRIRRADFERLNHEMVEEN